MSRETAPGSAGPRVTDKRRAEILHDAKEQPALLHTYSWFELADLLIEGAFLRAQNADLLASEKQRNENICTECGCPRLAKGECLMCENATLRAQNERLRERAQAFLDSLSGNVDDYSEGPEKDALRAALASTDTGESRDADR